jgi:hypothetical protein
MTRLLQTKSVLLLDLAGEKHTRLQIARS